MDQSIYCPFCSSVYEDAPYNYLIDYAFVNGWTARLPRSRNSWAWTPLARRFSTISTRPSAVRRHTTPCPFIWKIRSFRQWGLKRSTSLLGDSFRAGDNVLIGGFIVTGTDPKTIVLRALGPSLSGFGLSDVLSGSGSQRV